MTMDAAYGIGLYAAAGFVTSEGALERAVARLSALGHRVVVDPTCTTRWQRFSATDDERLAAVARMAGDPRVSVAMATSRASSLLRFCTCTGASMTLPRAVR